MRLSQLSAAAGLSPTTVKWYLRIGLLPRGEATATNQAIYDDAHLHRLRLIRALVEVGGLRTEAVREVLAAIDDPHRPMNDVLSVARRACAHDDAEPSLRSTELTDSFLAHRGWDVDPTSPARRELAAVLSAVAALQPAIGDIVTGPVVTGPVNEEDSVIELLDPYADAVEPLAETEIANTRSDLPRDLLTERVVAGTVLMERALAALRKLAQEHYAARQFRS